MKPCCNIHALAASARMANIPGVLGNVWLGIALAAPTMTSVHKGPFWCMAATLAMAGLCLYLAGCFLNDWADRSWDARHRPERALPQALFAPGIYLSVTMVFCLLGCGLAAAIALPCLLVALAIVICIGLYTWMHKRSVWSVVPMGLCRALLPVLGFTGCLAWIQTSAASCAALVACSCGLFFHIVGLSLRARGESIPRPMPGGIALAGILFPLAAASMLLATFLLFSFPIWLCISGLMPYAFWTGFCQTVARTPVTAHVSGALAGIPLLDWIVLLPLALAPGFDVWSNPIAVLCLCYPPIAFFSGRSLQRLAPAT